MTGSGYPLQFTIDYPDRQLSRLTTFFRLIVAIPIIIILGMLEGVAWEWSDEAGPVAAAGIGGMLFFAPLLMIVFREKYPRWWFDFNLELLRFSNRVTAYLYLMDDQYPSTDEQQSVHLDVPYPDVPNDLNRLLPLVKWLLALPHLIVLVVLHIGAIIAVVIAWFAIIVTGQYPRVLFDFVEGVLRWTNRVVAYAAMLVTDKYPPFSLEP